MHLIAELTCYDNHNPLIDVLKVKVPFAGLRTCIYSEPKLALRPGPFNQLTCTLVLSEGGIGIFGFAVLVFIAVHRLSVLKHLGFGIR